jgi:hypothetical protein
LVKFIIALLAFPPEGLGAMSDLSNVRVNGQRLWDALMEMAKIGGTPKGGCKRLTLTDVDKQGRALFQSWCEASGCAVKIDEMGNMFARRAGQDDSLPPVMLGSHLDTQPTGGKFDGVLGASVTRQMPPLAGRSPDGGTFHQFAPQPFAIDAKILEVCHGRPKPRLLYRRCESLAKSLFPTRPGHRVFNTLGGTIGGFR